VANIPDPGKAADSAKEAADQASKAADQASKAVDKAAKAAEDAKKLADKAKAKGKQALDLAKQAYDLARDPAMRDKAFAAAEQAAGRLQQQADKALGDAASAMRDAADGANQLYSALAGLGGAEMIPEVVRQQMPAVPNLVAQGVAAKLGQAAEELQGLPAAASNAAARALNAVKMPAMPAPPSSPALLACAASMPSAPAVKQEKIDSIVEAVGKKIGDHATRQQYEDEVKVLKTIAERMSEAGMRRSEIAETVSWLRRDLGERYKDMTPAPLREYIYHVNRKRYGDQLGPTYAALRERLLSNADIIKKASRPNPDVDKLLRGLKKWLGRQPDDTISKWASELAGKPKT